MTRVGIISDTHGCFDEVLQKFLAEVDVIWHAGDIGSIELADQIAAFKPLVAVHGNIDGGVTRVAYPTFNHFRCEGFDVLMTHIGGTPGHYIGEVERKLRELRPGIFVCGHSHILRVQYTDGRKLLHINPGAAGVSGFHRVRTAIRCVINEDDITDFEVGEWPRG